MLDKLSEHTSDDESLSQTSNSANTVLCNAVDKMQGIKEILTSNFELVQTLN